MSKRSLLLEPLSILDALTAAIADPFIYTPKVFKSTNPAVPDMEAAVISGYMHASPPVYAGITSIFDQLGIKSQTTRKFLMTSVSYDYK